MFYKNFNIVVLSVFLLFSSLLYGQDPVLIFEGKVTDVSGVKIEGVKITVKQNGSVYKSETTASNGKYKQIQCDFGHIYELTFSKSGYVSKSLLLDTKKGYYPEEVELKSFIESSVELFKEQPETDYSIVTDRPVGKARINPTDSKLDWDFTYVNQRKKEIENYIKQVANKARQKEEMFKKMVSEGNSAFSKANYSIAILKYKEALKIKSDETVVQKIKDAQAKMEQLDEDKEKNIEFQALIQKGDNLVLSEKFDDAIAVYNQAKELKPADQLPYEKIEDANLKKENLANAAINKQFQAKMGEAKKVFDKKEWESAKKLYAAASTIKPNERDPKDRIIQIDGIIANEKSAEENYNKLITDADQTVTDKDYDNAIKKYKSAIQIKPNESYPKEQIKKAEKLKAEVEQLALLGNKYNSKIESADKLFEKSSYIEARAFYNEALAIKANEEYPINKIASIDAKLKEIEDEKLKQQEIKKQYDAVILKADDAFYKEELDASKTLYEQALVLLPNESYPNQKIEEINAKIFQSNKEQEAKRKQYDNLIASADGYFENSNWEESKRLYNNALDVLKDEEYPKGQLIKIEQSIVKINEEKKLNDSKINEFNQFISNGDDEFAISKYQEAKDFYLKAKVLFPTNETVGKKIALAEMKLSAAQSLAEKQGKYDAFIKNADEFRDAKKWEESKSEYSKALAVFPEEMYPKKQIELMNSNISEAKRLEKQKLYQDLVDKADEFFEAKSYKDALDKFEAAKKILPTEAYPIDKIREIRRLVSQNEDLENQYNATISQADNMLNIEKWSQALDLYKRALTYFDREYPKEKIALIEEEKRKQNEKNIADTEKRKQYDELIAKGDSEFDSEDYATSKISFESALALFANEYYPKQKIGLINRKLTEIENVNADKTKYNEFISSADAARDSKNWNQAKDFYRKANSFDPIPLYPQEQIDWINEQMKKETEGEFKAQYEKLISAADDQFTSKLYEKSKELYERAKRMNPTDDYPLQRINEIVKLIKEIADNKLLEDKLNANQQKYNNLITLADGARDGQQWVKAKTIYKQAFEVKNTESYPQQQIDWINNKMRELASEEEETQYNKIIEVADNQFTAENYLKAIELYKRAKGMNPSDPYPPAQILKAQEARSTSLNKEKQTNLFNNHIKMGNSAYESKKYRLALRKFEDALKVRPEAPYPAEKISAINDILDKQAARKLSSTANKDLPTDFIDNYQVLYGEEVTGKYSESQIDQLIHKNRVDDDDYLQMKMSEEKDELIEAQTQIIDEQRVEGDKRYSKLNVMDDERLNSQQDNDNIRLDNIPQVDHFKEMESISLEQRNKYGKQSSYENSVLKDQIISEKSLDAQQSDIPRQENVPKAEFYKDGIYNTDEIMSQVRKEQTYDNNNSMDILISDRNLVELENDKSRQNKVPQVDSYKDEMSLSDELKADHFKVVTYSNYDTKEALNERISTMSSEADENRQKIVPKVDTYKDEVSNELSTIEQNRQNVTYSNFESKESLDDRISEFAQNADVQRQELIPELDRYLDKESDVQSVWSEVSSDKSYNQYTAKESMDNQRYSERLEKDISREMKSSELEAIQDLNSERQKENSDKDLIKDYQISSDLDDFKAFDPKAESQKYKQQLALEYPEGITEKMYQRKNVRGDVIEVTIIRVVIRGNQGDEYKKVTSKWGAYYFKNNLVISEYIWDSESN
jgi:tetratricopeptide (TPR) repeat protein